MGWFVKTDGQMALDDTARSAFSSLAASSPQHGDVQQYEKFFDGLHDPHNVLFWVQIVSMVLLLGYMLQRYLLGLTRKPKFSKPDVVYQEYFASGSSHRNFLTKIGGANGCLRLVVTKDVLWVTSWFPFSLFAALYDLEHVIPLAKIVSLETTSSFGKQGFLFTFTNQQGDKRVLKLRPRNMEQFVRALEPRLNQSSRQGVTLQVGPIEPALSLGEAVRKYWHHILVMGLFPTVAFVGGGYFKIPFGFFIPLFFASVIYGQWPVMTKRVPYMFGFVLGAAWLGGGVFAALLSSVISAVAPHYP